MNITREEVLKMAKISRITVHENEIDGLIKQLSDVLGYAQKVQKLAQELGDIEPMGTTNVNLFRHDVAHSFDASQLLARAPEHESGYFVVPKIIEGK